MPLSRAASAGASRRARGRAEATRATARRRRARSPPPRSRRAPRRPGARSRGRGRSPACERASRARWKRSNTNGRSSSLKPGPWSRTLRTPACERRPRRAPPDGLHLHALSSRFDTARAIRSPSPRTSVGCEIDLEAQARRSPARPARLPSSTIWSRRTSPGSPLGFVPRASSTTSPRARVSSSSSSIMSAAQRLPVLRRAAAARPQELEVRAQRRDRRAQLVRGVGDQVALRLRPSLERVERRR